MDAARNPFAAAERQSVPQRECAVRCEALDWLEVREFVRREKEPNLEESQKSLKKISNLIRFLAHDDPEFHSITASNAYFPHLWLPC